MFKKLTTMHINQQPTYEHRLYESYSDPEKAFNVVLEMLETIDDLGYEGYIVGGAVRDMILDVPCDDYDIVTNLPFEKMKKLGDISGRISRDGNDILFIKRDGLLIDVKRISPKKTFEEELLSRDLTINAMSWSPLTNKMIDPLGGEEDTKNHILHFTEESLKKVSSGKSFILVLRLIRFHSTLSFSISEESIKALYNFSKKCKRKSITNGRFKNNYKKLLEGQSAKSALYLLKSLDLYDFCKQKWDELKDKEDE